MKLRAIRITMIVISGSHEIELAVCKAFHTAVVREAYKVANQVESFTAGTRLEWKEVRNSVADR